MQASSTGWARSDATGRTRVAPEFSTPSAPPDTIMTSDQNAQLAQLARLLSLLGEGAALPATLAGAGGRRLRVIEAPAPGIRFKLLDESQPDRFPPTILFPSTRTPARELPEDLPFVPGIALALTTFPRGASREGVRVVRLRRQRDQWLEPSTGRTVPAKAIVERHGWETLKVIAHRFGVL